MAYSYLRFSSPDQAKGDSLRRQTELRDAWLARSKVKLDTSVHLRDEGVSGFTGEHRSNPDRHALAAFLELVRSGRIPRGSYLIVESLDRLSREHIRPALTLLLNLIDAGIRVVQLLPVVTLYDENVEPMQLMMGIMELSRGHSESLIKSERVGRAWQEKKRRAAADGDVLTKQVPGWLTVTGGKIVVIPERANTVRRIFKLAIEGHGLVVITKRLNAEKVPPMGRARHWASSYVSKILANRAVYGEYQPHKGHAGPNRKPDGPPITTYFPKILSEEDYLTARAALALRRNKRGRIGKSVNIFQGILRDARDGGTIHQTDKGKKSSGKMLVSYRAALGLPGSKYVSFPFEVFERAILSRLREIDPKEILPRGEIEADQVMMLAGKLGEIDGRIAKIKSKMFVDENLDVLVDVLRTLDGERKVVADHLAMAKQAASSPISEGWGEFRNLVDVLEQSKNLPDSRTRLRAALRRIVSEIWCLFIASGRHRYACVQVFFAGGGPSRDYLIAYKPAHRGFQGRTEPHSEVRSGLYPEGDIDLRKRNQVPKIEKILLRLLAKEANS